ncbi:class I adenylate-forming enzyme family protein [Enterovirga rhinocerotis]|uniref:Acyl-CoA synthetase (AMP-forming)/AMP-acid ligase II n=1 Tax=Enterovirga rhinocerotis TaxID=1339210 RepID=A0A4R7BXZ8_9HYPH|nr:class I adenylate-forming enzyme family protein [Enterovirga rhinocerotis]TDR88886.1 acyl-CoA synthetase (AMP-forming)/AMP-acid ligase II [Enterovirga rhinocerotis]
MSRSVNLGDLADPALDPTRLAVIDLRDPAAPRAWTHGEIDGLARGVARHLAARGFPRGTSIGILSLNRAEYLAAYFGIMRAGHVAVPVNTKLPRETVSYILGDARIALAFTDAGGRDLVDGAVETIGFDDPGPGGFGALIVPGPFETVVPGPEEIGQLLYTSGSTGRPKGVPLTHAGQLWALSTRTGDLGAHERYLIAQPLFHMNGLFSAKTVFATNASVVVMPSFSARAYLEALARHQVTALMAVPTMFARLIKEADLVEALDLSSLKRIGLGSAPITLGLLERIEAAFPAARIGLGYGTTEAGPAVFGPHPDGLPPPPLALGYPLDPSGIRLVDGAGDDEGVLMMRNPAVTPGYLNLPEQSAKAIREGWYYSGDVMRRDADGFFFFVGRADDMFVCAGENIYPGEVEKMLERHPSVQQAAVVPLPDEERSQIPVAFIVTKPSAPVGPEEIRTFALANGPAYQHPRRIEFLSDLPWAGTNKIDRRALIERARLLESGHGWSSEGGGARIVAGDRLAS